METNGSWSFFAPKNRTHVYVGLALNMSAAEQFCVSQGGRLASICSQEEQDEVSNVAGIGWLGGKRKVGTKWEWLDDRTAKYGK